MAPRCYRMYKQCFLILILVFLYQTEAKPKGGRRTGGGGSKYGNTGTRHTQTHNTGYNTHNSGHHDTVHHSNTYNTGNSHPVVPSAPVGGPGQHQIGFEHFNNNNQQHGGGGSGPQNPHGIGFDNVNRQNSHPTQHPIGYNVNQHNNHGSGVRNNSGGGGGYHGGYNNNHGSGYRNNSAGGGGYHGGYNNNNRFNSSSNVPLNAGHPGGNNYYHQGGHYQSPYIAPNPPGGYHNPNFAQPQAYYHQYHPAPNMPPPVIYQPYQQQSSGGSALGYVGSLAGGLAGGYLIGRLTSGGSSGHSSNTNTITNNNYEVHHYYNNGNEVPKQLSVSNSSLATCAPNATQGLCVPNTFPVCLYNGTIMCVTHTIYTTPCVGLNTTSSCVISLVPACVSGDPKCNSTNTTAMYIPCLSNVTLTNPGSGNVVAPSSGSAGQSLVGDKVELCVTAIAEPKFPPPQMFNQQPQYNGNMGPSYQAPGQPPVTKGAGTKESAGWAFALIAVLLIGVN